MSQQNVARLRDAYDAYARRGDPSLLAALVDPQCEIHDVKTIPDAEIHHGPDGLIRSQAKFAEIFDDLRVEADEVIDAGDRVSAQVAAVWTMRGERVIRGEYYNDWAEAREAVGRPDKNPR
jgi:ketosteroid isomerase-like protein